jgi:DNA-binding response OmpR family regulator
MHITIVEDEKILSKRIKQKLESIGFAVSTFHSYEDFMNHWDSGSQLYMIDIALNGKNWFDIIQWLRQSADCKSPIMIISWYCDSEMIVRWLNIGADDYLIKPFNADEMAARIKALMRRPYVFAPKMKLTYKSISFNPEKNEAKVGESLLCLTHKENMILELFLNNQSILVSREKLINYIWGWHNMGDVSDNTINVTLSKLRKKVGEDFTLKTLYNGGYMLD